MEPVLFLLAVPIIASLILLIQIVTKVWKQSKLLVSELSTLHNSLAPFLSSSSPASIETETKEYSPETDPNHARLRLAEIRARSRKRNEARQRRLVKGIR